MSYGVTADEVRLTVGIGTGDISDTDMASLITRAEHETDRILNTAFQPRRVVERHDLGLTQPFVMLRRTPVTRVVSIQVGGTGGTSVDPSHAYLDAGSGKLALKGTAETTSFSTSEDGNVIDYYYARMDEDQTNETTLSAATGTGTGVVVSVGSSGIVSANDYVKFEGGRSGAFEVTKVLSVGNGTFSADLSVTHAAYDRVVKMQVPEIAKEMCRTVAGIMSALNMVGSTYNFATSYSLPEYTISKGEPYPQLNRVLEGLTRKRDDLMQNAIRPQTSVY